ncbi:MAG: hypothetical protein ACRC7O_07755, partial [Fimbriiglobus sp.]
VVRPTGQECECRAPGCRGTRAGYHGLPAKRKAQYGRFVAEYLRETDTPAPRATLNATAGVAANANV